MHRTTVLTDSEIRRLLLCNPPLLEDMVDAEIQIQPCGVDLTVRRVSSYISSGTVDFDNSHRTLSVTEPWDWNGGHVFLPAGAYHIVYNEKVNLPRDVMALAYPRSSLLRCGVTVHTAVWDPGYSGRGEALLIVYNQAGFRLERWARVVQLVFTRLGNIATEGYRGRFHGENE
ncbi:MAG TPA: deoxyuridine 5'-triphosphate nucleotidohydrolase [Dehalococcoidia bacterium]|nr:deoxyuridine 5'-triphosphate nucleotidohydrolase [Dehalococcoidia bacterium]